MGECRWCRFKKDELFRLLTLLQIWAAGLVGGFFFASIALRNPKFLKWHLALGATFEMVFLATLRALVRTDQYRMSMAFFFLSGLGLGYVTIITYVTAPMTARKRDLGLCVGLISAYRNMIFAVIRQYLPSLLFNGHYLLTILINRCRVLDSGKILCTPLMAKTNMVLVCQSGRQQAMGNLPTSIRESRSHPQKYQKHPRRSFRSSNDWQHCWPTQPSHCQDNDRRTAHGFRSILAIRHLSRLHLLFHCLDIHLPGSGHRQLSV